MKTPLNILGIIFLLAGGIFFLQGVNILPGSFMTGDPGWAVRGGLLILVGIGILLWVRRAR